MRRSVIIRALAALVVVSLLAPGCARRDDPASAVATGNAGTVTKFTHDYGPTGFGYLPANGDGLTLTESPSRTSKTYRPPEYRTTGQGRPYPVLYLLLDWGGNGSNDDVTDEYYFEVGLRLLADSLILGGVIKPMIIATVDLYNAYGGSWYQSNNIQGMYESCLTEFVAYTDTATNFSRQNGRLSRAISGVGMGGYGAIYMAMAHPDLFSSASSINGHLAFTTLSTKHHFRGIDEWIPFVFQENFVTPVSPFVPPTRAELLPYYSMSPDINRALRKPYTNLMFSMAAAFSPFDPATATLQDSLTWMNAALAGGEERSWKVTMPFDWSGNLWPNSWTQWRANDVAQILSFNPVALAGVQVLVMAGTTAEFNILQQNRVFYDVAVARGASTVHYKEFDGYSGYDTARRNFLDRTLRDILVFHSEQFVDPATLGP
jgi:hypothetical protein